MKRAWLLDEDVFICGYSDNYVFYPNSKECGFDYQKFDKQDIEKIIFYDFDKALKKYGNLRIIY